MNAKKIVALALTILTSLLVGCPSNAGPLRATLEYVELAKDEGGQVKEVGEKHTLRAGSDEMYSIHGKELDVVTVTAANAKFRLRGGDSEKAKEAEIQPGTSQDLWLGPFGVRIRVEKIGPI